MKRLKSVSWDAGDVLCCSNTSGCQKQQGIIQVQGFRVISPEDKNTLCCLLLHKEPQHGAVFLYC